MQFQRPHITLNRNKKVTKTALTDQLTIIPVYATTNWPSYLYTLVHVGDWCALGTCFRRSTADSRGKIKTCLTNLPPSLCVQDEVEDYYTAYTLLAKMFTESPLTVWNALSFHFHCVCHISNTTAEAQATRRRGDHIQQPQSTTWQAAIQS